MHKHKKIKMIDLCAGTGAFSYAFQQTDLIDVVYANDIDENSKKIYDANFDHELTLGDMCKIDIKTIPKHDIITIGFACQPWSIAGKQNGFSDKRTDVFWKLIDIIKYHKPECVIIENVKNLVSHDDGKSFETMLNILKKEKYFIKYEILNTSDITEIPQHRERVYIICLKNEKLSDKFKFDFEKIKNKKITKLLQKNIDDKYYYNNKSSKIHKMIIDEVNDKNAIYQFRRIYVRKNKSGVCPTLTANMGTGGHNVPIVLTDKGARKLTPRECFNFQGFPNDYNLPNICDGKLYKLAGNAVSVPVVKLIANKLIPDLYILLIKTY